MKFKPEATAAHRKKIRITTCKRMITQIQNKINRYEEEQKTLLLPNLEDPGYIKAKQKVINYREELETLLKP